MENKWPTWQEVIDFIDKERNRTYVPPVHTIYVGLETWKEMQADPHHPLWFGSKEESTPNI